MLWLRKLDFGSRKRVGDKPAKEPQALVDLADGISG
jgi:hypothetical protein